MAVVTATEQLTDDATVPALLTDDAVPALLEAFARSGSIRASARATGVQRQSVYERRYRDPQFRHAFDTARGRRLYDASDELMDAIDEFRHLTGAGDWEKAVDELVNVAFAATAPPLRKGVNPERLAAARERLSAAGLEWAAAVVQAMGPARSLDKLIERGNA